MDPKIVDFVRRFVETLPLTGNICSFSCSFERYASSHKNFSIAASSQVNFSVCPVKFTLTDATQSFQFPKQTSNCRSTDLNDFRAFCHLSLFRSHHSTLVPNPSQVFFQPTHLGELEAIKSASFIRSSSLFSSVLTAGAGQQRALIVKGFVCRTDLKECDRKPERKRRDEKSIKGKSMRMSNYIPITHFFNLMLRLQLTIHISQSKLCFFFVLSRRCFFCYAHK